MHLSKTKLKRVSLQYDSRRITLPVKLNNRWCRKYKNGAHFSFDLARLETLLSEEVLICAPDPLVSSFYVCVVLRNIREHVFSEELKVLHKRLESFAFHYLDLCRTTWEARALVTKEGLY